MILSEYLDHPSGSRVVKINVSGIVLLINALLGSFLIGPAYSMPLILSACITQITKKEYALKTDNNSDVLSFGGTVSVLLTN